MDEEERARRYLFDDDEIATALADAKPGDKNKPDQDAWDKAEANSADAVEAEGDLSDGETAKAAQKRQPHVVHPKYRDPLASPQGERTESEARAVVHSVFKAMGPAIAAQVVAAVRKLPKKTAAMPGLMKAGEDDTEASLDETYSVEDAEDIANAIDLSDLDALAADGKLAETLGTLAQFTGNEVLAQIGVQNNDELVNQFNVDAFVDATDQAAALVGKKWVNGQLVDNPNAQWAITESTRSMIQQAVVQSFVQGYGIDELQTFLENSFGFSEARARMIARTESLRAANGGIRAGLVRAQEAGVVLKKVWLAAPDSCDECIDNEDEGPIDLYDTFSTGDDAPPAHPNCRCSLSSEVDVSASGESDTSESE